MRVGRFAVAALLVAGCDHSFPSSFGESPREPLTTTSPRQVTFNLGSDLRPSWAADGSGILYSRQRLDRPDKDWCLGLLPPAGGGLVREICDRTLVGADSLTAFESAAMAADGRLAYVRASSPLGVLGTAPRTLELWVGTLADPEGSIVKTFPYDGPSGRRHLGLDWLQWDGSNLVYLGETLEYTRPFGCTGCPLDTVRTGLDVVSFDPVTALTMFVPGTDSATSVAADGDVVYYSLPGDDVVWKRTLSTSLTEPAYTAGGGETPRDVTVASGRLAFVTGVGHLWLVSLAGGAPGELTAAGILFKHPALAPDGRRLVAEGYPFFVSGGDTVVTVVGDLWLFDLP